MTKMKALVCRECGKEYPTKAIHVCEMCFGPLEVKYNYDEIKKVISRKKIADGPQSMWRYIDLLPVEGTSLVGPHAGLTPLVRAKNLGAFLGLDELYIKNDTVNHPTLSFKDRVVSVALTRARELGFETVACASTGNLANSVAAHAAASGMQCYVFIPADLEAAKVLGNLIYKPNVVEVEGNYDDVNRLCSEIAAEHGWAFVNINIRPYYAEGSKTLAYETVEQLGWRTPDQVVIPGAILVYQIQYTRSAALSQDSLAIQLLKNHARHSMSDGLKVARVSTLFQAVRASKWICVLLPKGSCSDLMPSFVAR